MDTHTARRTNSTRDALIVEHIDMARRLARKIARRVPPSVGRDELESAALLGLTEAATRYDDTRGEPFVAYAAKRVRGAVLDELRRRDALTRRRRQDARKLDAARRTFEATEGREATTQDLAESLGMSIDELADFESRSTIPTLVPIDEMRDMDRTASSQSAEDRIELSRRAQALREALPQLPEREQLVLAMYYNEGLTQKEIGAILGVSESRVCQLRTRAVRSLRSYLSCAADAA